VDFGLFKCDVSSRDLLFSHHVTCDVSKTPHLKLIYVHDVSKTPHLKLIYVQLAFNTGSYLRREETVNKNCGK